MSPLEAKLGLQKSESGTVGQRSKKWDCTTKSSVVETYGSDYELMLQYVRKYFCSSLSCERFTCVFLTNGFD